MRRLLAVLLALLCPLAFAADAGPDAEALKWIARIYSAGRKLNYSGVIVYQAGERSETSRIVHLFDAGHELEKLEALDGSPREVIRTRDLVKCYLPRQRTLIVDQASGSRGFPARLVASEASLSENYRIRLGPMGRVAGLEAQQVVLEPRDELRFGHMLWADANTGLLLKARMQDEAGGIVEQFTFTELRVGDEIRREEFTSQFENAQGWQVISAGGAEARGDGLGWRVNAEVPGFRQVRAVRRTLEGVHGEVVHMVFSDGLVAMSVFIEPASALREPTTGASNSGPVNIFARRIGGFVVTAVGETPPRAVQVLAEAVMAVPK